jgi:hypothetical protein
MRLSFYGASLIYSACHMYFCKRLYRKNKAFKFLGHYAAWPKVADAVSEALHSLKD